MVLDFRKLNEKTIGDSYPLPNIIDILDQIGSAQYFSVFDLVSRFHQIKMSPKDSHTTAFSTPYVHYEFDRMPFGLKNAPATFERLMDLVLTGLQRAVKNFPIPKNPKNIKQFSGLAGYYRRFIDGFPKIATPLNQLLKKDVKFDWSEKLQEAFELLNNWTKIYLT